MHTAVIQYNTIQYLYFTRVQSTAMAESEARDDGVVRLREGKHKKKGPIQTVILDGPTLRGFSKTFPYIPFIEIFFDN